MNVFYEFHKNVQHLQREGVEYSLIGGVAIAFHAVPRFTKDIDLLLRKSDLPKMTAILNKEGYFSSSAPWTIKNSGLTLHRFFKMENEDGMIVDVLLAGNDDHDLIIRNTLETEAKGTGVVRIAPNRL